MTDISERSVILFTETIEMAGRKILNCGLYNGLLTGGFRLPIHHYYASTLSPVSLFAVAFLLTTLIGHAESLSPSITQLAGGGSGGQAAGSSAAAASSSSQVGEWNPSLPQTCQRIEDLSSTTGICADMPYNYTTMPNLVGQQEFVEALASLESYTLLIKSQCSPQLKFFLCSVHLPMCSPIAHTDSIVVVPPCRRLCKDVRTKCEPVLHAFKYNWPEEINCDSFPEDNKSDDMCMPGETDPGNEPASEKAAGEANHTHSTDDLANQPAVVNPPVPSPPARHPGLCGQPENAFVYINTTRSCAPVCTADFITSREEKFYADIFHGVVVGLTVCSVSVVGVLFACKGKRTTEQEKPVFMILLCLLVVASAYVVRLAGGRRVGCSEDTTEEAGRPAFLVGYGTEMPAAPCVIIFILQFYFGLAGGIWWLVMTVVWFCSAVREAKVESIRRLVKRCHWFAWSLPAVLTGVGIAGKLIDSDELTALCYVGQQNSWNLLLLVIVPLGTITVTGAGVLVTGCIQLTRRKCFLSAKTATLIHKPTLSTISDSKSQSRDKNLFALCALFLPSTAIVIGCHFTEWLHREKPQLKPDDLHVALFFVRVIMQFIYGPVAAVWFCVTSKRRQPAKQTGHQSIKHQKALPSPIFIPPSITTTGQMKVVENSYCEDTRAPSDFYNSIVTGPYSPSPSVLTASTQFPGLPPGGSYGYDQRLVGKMLKQQDLSKREFCRESYRSMPTDGVESFV